MAAWTESMDSAHGSTDRIKVRPLIHGSATKIK
jgi:hypothetical protein